MKISISKKYLRLPKFFELFSLLKVVLARASLIALARSVEAANGFDPRIRREVASWPEGLSIGFCILPSGPSIMWKVVYGRLKYMGRAEENLDLGIYFKNITCALLLLTPRMGIAQGFAENRAYVKGDLEKAVSFLRCLNILLAYLYPTFISRRLLKDVPKLRYDLYFRRLYLYFLAIPFGL